MKRETSNASRQSTYSIDRHDYVYKFKLVSLVVVLRAKQHIVVPWYECLPTYGVGSATGPPAECCPQQRCGSRGSRLPRTSLYWCEQDLAKQTIKGQDDNVHRGLPGRQFRRYLGTSKRFACPIQPRRYEPLPCGPCSPTTNGLAVPEQRVLCSCSSSRRNCMTACSLPAIRSIPTPTLRSSHFLDVCTSVCDCVIIGMEILH